MQLEIELESSSRFLILGCKWNVIPFGDSNSIHSNLVDKKSNLIRVRLQDQSDDRDIVVKANDVKSPQDVGIISILLLFSIISRSSTCSFISCMLCWWVRTHNVLRGLVTLNMAHTVLVVSLWSSFPVSMNPGKSVSRYMCIFVAFRIKH